MRYVTNGVASIPAELTAITPSSRLTGEPNVVDISFCVTVSWKLVAATVGM